MACRSQRSVEPPGHEVHPVALQRPFGGERLPDSQAIVHQRLAVGAHGQESNSLGRSGRRAAAQELLMGGEHLHLRPRDGSSPARWGSGWPRPPPARPPPGPPGGPPAPANRRRHRQGSRASRSRATRSFLTSPASSRGPKVEPGIPFTAEALVQLDHQPPRPGLCLPEIADRLRQILQAVAPGRFPADGERRSGRTAPGCRPWCPSSPGPGRCPAAAPATVRRASFPDPSPCSSS